MRILVTGGAGYIGSHTCKALAQAGFEPVVFDNLETGHRAAVRWGPLVVGDIADRARLEAAVLHFNPAAVVHFAAYAYVGESVSDPLRYYRNNVGGTLALLDVCRARGIDRLILSSTCATYGAPAHLPILEATPQAPINPYGRSKLMIEQILADMGAAYGFRSVALRYFNAAGADLQGELREDHDPETHLIPRALMAAAHTAPPLDLFGDDYPTPDGTCIRDYIHVADLADAHVQALRYLLAGGESVALNVGSGRGTSIREILSAIWEVTGRDVPVRLAKRRPGDPPILVADPGEARQRLGFVARYSDLSTIIRTASTAHMREEAA